MGGGFDTGFRPTQPPGSIQAFALLSHQARYRLSPYSATRLDTGFRPTQPPGSIQAFALLSHQARYRLSPYSATRLDTGFRPTQPPGSIQAFALLSHQARYGFTPYSATEWERLLSSPLGRTEATAPIPLLPLNCDFTHFFFQTFLAKCFKSSYSPLIRASFFFFDQP